MHFYRIEIPDIFLNTKGRRGITLSLAYDPPVRASRRAYLARTMTIDAYHGLTTDQVQLYCSKQENQAELSLPSWAELKFTPSKSKVHWSTLQVRKKTWTRKPLIKTPNGEESRTIHVVVRCQQRFPTGEDEFQKYGLVVVFWHENTQIELYQALQNQVTLRATRIRV
jgi:hypothetical protein